MVGPLRALTLAHAGDGDDTALALTLTLTLALMLVLMLTALPTALAHAGTGAESGAGAQGRNALYTQWGPALLRSINATTSDPDGSGILWSDPDHPVIGYGFQVLLLVVVVVLLLLKGASCWIVLPQVGGRWLCGDCA
jgi:hypothetical protein